MFMGVAENKCPPVFFDSPGLLVLRMPNRLIISFNAVINQRRRPYPQRAFIGIIAKTVGAYPSEKIGPFIKQRIDLMDAFYPAALHPFFRNPGMGNYPSVVDMHDAVQFLVPLVKIEYFKNMLKLIAAALFMQVIADCMVGPAEVYFPGVFIFKRNNIFGIMHLEGPGICPAVEFISQKNNFIKIVFLIDYLPPMEGLMNVADYCNFH